MRREIKHLLLVYVLFVGVKAFLSYFVQGPTIFGDEYVYAKLARNFFEHGVLTYHGGVVSKFPPLYPILISFSYVFENMYIVYFVMKVINSMLSSLVIFPIYLLAREFLSSKKSLFIAILVGLYPAFFNMSNYVMSENLFYPLFLFTILFTYLGFKEEKWYYFLLSGVFIGLSYQARVLTTILVPLTFIVWLFYRKNFRYVILHYALALLVVLPELYKHVQQYGFSVIGILGGYKGPTFVAESVSGNFFPFLNWIVLYFGYVLLASGILFGLYYLYGLFVKDKKFKLLFTIVTVTLVINILVMANQANVNWFYYLSPFVELYNSRMSGRYIDMTVALVMLLGYIVYDQFTVKKKNIVPLLFGSSLVLLWSAQLSISPMFPLNNQALSFYGALQSAFEYVVYGEIFLGSSFHWLVFIFIAFVFFSLLWMLYYLREHKKVVLTLVTLFFVFGSLFAYSATVWNSSQQSGSEQEELAFYLNDVLEKSESVYLDKSLSPERGTLLGFWLDRDIVVDIP